MNRGLIYGVLAVSVLALSACSGDMDDLKTYVATIKARKGGRIEPLPQIQPYQSFTYEDDDLRSPFVPDNSNQQQQVAATSNSAIHPDFNRNKEYLEQFPLDGIKFKGTIVMNGAMWALVEDSDGVVHRVTGGNHLGQNYGKITKITESEIDLTEIVPDGLGGWMERPMSIALSDE